MSPKTPKFPFVVAGLVLIGIVTLKLTLVPTTGASARASFLATIAAEPALDAGLLTREAPRDLPTENWNPI